jgi:hypothetical protein
MRFDRATVVSISESHGLVLLRRLDLLCHVLSPGGLSLELLSMTSELIELLLSQLYVDRSRTSLLERLLHQLDIAEPAFGGFHNGDDLFGVAELPVSTDEYVALEKADVVLQHRFLEEHLHDRHGEQYSEQTANID